MFFDQDKADDQGEKLSKQHWETRLKYLRSKVKLIDSRDFVKKSEEFQIPTDLETRSETNEAVPVFQTQKNYYKNSRMIRKC